MYELFLAAIPIVIIMYIIGRKVPRGKLPPGPTPLFFVGNVQDLDKTRVHQSLHNLAKRFGPLTYLMILRQKVIVLNSAQVLRKAFSSSEYRELMNDKPPGFYGKYLVYGHQDVLLGPYSDTTFKLKAVMHKGILPSMTESQIEAEVKLLIDLFQKTNGVTFDPRRFIEDTLAGVMSVLFSGDAQPGDSKLLWEFVDSSNTMLNPSIAGVLKHFPFLRHLPGTLGHLYRTAREKRDNVLQRFFDEYRSTFTPTVIRGFVDTCLQIQETEKDSDGVPWLSDDKIRAILLDTIGGGLPATAESVLGAILNLLHNRQCVVKMLAEINDVLARDQLPTGNDIKRMPYCHAVIIETLRLTTVVPLVNHCISKHDGEFEGFTIPKDTVLFGNIWSAHHDETVWKDPWAFRPERFLGDKGSLLPADHELRQSFMPFGLGARYCVGDVFAKTRLFVYITALVQHFDFLPPDGAELVSNDPNLCSGGAVLNMPTYTLRTLPRN